MKKCGYMVKMFDRVERYYLYTDYETFDKVTAQKIAKRANREQVRQWGRMPVKYKAIAYK